MSTARVISFPSSQPLGPEPFLNRREIAAFMRVSVRTIDNWVTESCPHETWGLRTRVFRASEVVEWAQHRARRRTSGGL